eukprot:6976674-Prymnesium_polylepis.1
MMRWGRGQSRGGALVIQSRMQLASAGSPSSPLRVQVTAEQHACQSGCCQGSGVAAAAAAAAAAVAAVAGFEAAVAARAVSPALITASAACSASDSSG